jgi:hypothetical protein
MRRALFWITFLPLGLTLMVVGLIMWIGDIVQGLGYMYNELLDQWENWCFYGPFGRRQDSTLMKAFWEGYNK